MNIRSDAPFAPNMDFGTAVSLGMVNGMKENNQTSGREITIAAVEVDITTFTDVYVWPNDAGEPMEVVSTSAADVQTVLIRYLDPEGFQQDEQVTLNGITPVPMIATPRRINLVFNSSGVEYIGDINVQAAGGGTIFSQVPPQTQKSVQGFFTVPVDKVAFVYGVISSMTKTGGPDTIVTSRLMARLAGGVFVQQFTAGMQRTGDTSPEFTNKIPELTPPLTDILLRAEASAVPTNILMRLPSTLVDKRLANL